MSSQFTIKQIFKEHWDSFVILNPNIRPVVHAEVRHMLSCGDISKGFAMYQCPACGNYKFVPFRCHSRFCNTCGVAYQADRADSIAAKLINCKHRHVVFTIAEELRPYFHKDRRLLSVLFRTSAQVISDWLYSQNHKEHFTAGMVIGLHTFGRDLKWNPHIHMLLTEGAVGSLTAWKPIRFFPFTMLRKKWMTALLANLKDALAPQIFSLERFTQLVNFLYRNYTEGFYVNAPSSSFNQPKAVANYITRYIGRPAMAQSRITGYDGNFVTFWYQRHEDHKKIFETVPAHEFIKKLIIHIPEKNFHMLRYYGLYARPFASTKNLIRLMPAHFKKVCLVMHKWAFRLEAAFHYDPLKCSCGHSMDFVDTYFPLPYSHSPPAMVNYSHTK